jgi:hypothetical protein
MSDAYLQIRKVVFRGPNKSAEVDFTSGVNVICGASDTGKSFLAESIDYMLGGSKLREIPELVGYAQIELQVTSSEGQRWLLSRAVTGGDFELTDLNEDDAEPETLRQNHAHGKTDNLSGVLLDEIGLFERRILRSSKKGTTQSLSFRNLARLIIVQEGEIQRTGSPFWGGQYTLKTAELATVKLLLTGVDDSAVVSTDARAEADSAKQIELIDEMLSDLESEISDLGKDQDELDGRIDELTASIDDQRESLSAVQSHLDERVVARRKLFSERSAIEDRLTEIAEHLSRFALLREHYAIDTERLEAIRESGSMFAHVEQVNCPLCGAAPSDQHLDETCDGDVDTIVVAAAAEIVKIERLTRELADTVSELKEEAIELADGLVSKTEAYEKLDKEIRKSLSPELGDARAAFSEIVEEKAAAQKAKELFERASRLEDRKGELLEEDELGSENQKISFGIPDAVAHALSRKIESILEDWNFPGECRVHYDKETSDFVIDGKPRASRGKGLRAITHAAVTLGLLEFCQENQVPHPGFVLLDSPLLAYFKPEGDDDIALQGSDLKERFYAYLVEHHGTDSQIIIVENQHPPSGEERNLNMTVFTHNPGEGRFGLL